MKVCIYGAGAIGGWLGSGLARAGCQVSLVARGSTLSALQQHGLRLVHSSPDGPLMETHLVACSATPAELGVQDLVVVAVKGPALADIARQIGPLLGPDTAVLTAMNGVPWWFLQGFGGPYAGRRLNTVDPDGLLESALPARHLIGGVVHASCSVEAPGLVRHHFGNRLVIGEPSGQVSERATRLARLLQQGGFEVTLTAEIQKEIWFKLWGNMTVNPISALTGATTDLIMRDELVRNFISSVMMEAKAIGERLGITLDQQPEDRHAVTRKLGAFKTSMLQDVEAGKAVEIDALIASVRELGEMTAISTPGTDALLGLARLQAQVRGLYPQ